uniref:Uncharacterized protein n=1 Tax=Anguilla anguilla TaxID=7936 RepID=A0A0E9TJ14_ANGAN
MKYTCYKETSDTLLHTAKKETKSILTIFLSLYVCEVSWMFMSVNRTIN